MRRFINPTFLKAAIWYWTGKSTKDPHFIIGTGRCGSSLLVDVLASNEAVKTSQFEWYHTFLKTLKRSYAAQDFLTDIIDIEKVSEESVRSWNAFDRFYMKALFKYFASYSDKTYIIKSPAISLILKELQQLFPKGKFIHLYRNPYAVTLSVYKKEYFRVERYREVYTETEFKAVAANYWNSSMKGVEDFLNSIDKETFLEFSYEEFTKDARKKTAEIAGFLNISNNFSYDFSTIRSTNYKIENLSTEEVKMLNPIFREMMEKKNYEPIH
ncbi:MAG: sulfotransferase [Flavobacteriaceae bacterium]|nr:sulfotransferase [Flavobacteriaceae bacterium]